MFRVTMDDHTGRPAAYQADSYEELARATYEDAFLPFDPPDEWMEGLVSRRKLRDRSIVRMDSAKNDITDLDACESIRLEILQ